jgi:hypothetical protein
MPIILKNNIHYSNYRLKKMFNTESEATKLRGWDRFKEFMHIKDQGKIKKEQLKNLYFQLHLDTNKINFSKNINYLIIFNNMTKIFKDNQVKFLSTIFEQSNNNSFKIELKINNKLLFKFHCNSNEGKFFIFLMKQDKLNLLNLLKYSFAKEKILAIYKGWMSRKPEVKTIKTDINYKPPKMTIRNSTKKVIAYKINDLNKNNFIKVPPQIIDLEIKGYNKKLTHRDINYVGLSLINQNYVSFNKSILDNMFNNEHHFVIQYRVNHTLLLSANMGNDLFELLKKEFMFKVESFLPLVNEIDILHENNIVHRDIKLENMFYKNGEIFLSDLDNMGEIGSFKSIAGTYIFPVDMFIKSKIDFYNDKVLAKKQDKYTLLSVLYMCFIKIDVLDNYSNKFFGKKIDEFLNICINPNYHDQVKKFLLDPISYDINDPLSKLLLTS